MVRAENSPMILPFWRKRGYPPPQSLRLARKLNETKLDLIQPAPNSIMISTRTHAHASRASRLTSMDGMKFAGFVRSEHPVLKIVLTSGDLAALDRAEHDGFFPKPYDGGKVIKHIKALLTEERANSLSRYPT